MKPKPAAPRPRLTPDEVMQRVYDKYTQLVEHMYLDRDWVWYCGESLQGEANKPIRAFLKEIGFRFCPGGHLMQDQVTRGSWGNACHHPTFPRRKPKSHDPIAALAELFV